MKHTKIIKVAIADSHPLFVKGFAELISKHPRCVIAFCVYNGTDIIDAIKLNKPDIIFMDIRMPKMNGIEATKLVKKHYPEIKVIAISMEEHDDCVTDMLQAGAVGYICKDAQPEEVILAITDVYDKGFHLNRIVTIELLDKLGIIYNTEPQSKKTINLTERELEVLTLMCMDRNTNQIAKELNISTKTVGKHRENMHLKTGTHTPNGLVSFAHRHKLIA